MFKLPFLHKGDTVGLIACSDGIKHEDKPKIDRLIAIFKDWGLKIDIATTIYRREGFFSGPATERARELNRLFEDRDIKAIFDVSGGDAANHILDQLDFDMIKENAKPFFGLSDLSVILNSLYSMSGLETYHYYIMNLVRENGDRQQKDLYSSLFQGNNDLFDFGYHWLRGSNIRGKVIGGNLRCSLKLAGTKYFPNYRERVILLESLSGRANRLTSLITQWYHLGVFHECAGIILGTFTELEEHNEFPIIKDYVLELTEHIGVPIVKTDEIGHNPDSKAIAIGKEVIL
ncbi:MAG: LD-carboxypeptidase [Clostridiales bacterium]|nr:LD-carboxypeptidase [Clostridiales bacterium]